MEERYDKGLANYFCRLSCGRAGNVKILFGETLCCCISRRMNFYCCYARISLDSNFSEIFGRIAQKFSYRVLLNDSVAEVGGWRLN
jgi:hypothetical protein